eukprot:3864722-Rhodomonas_salina.2
MGHANACAADKGACRKDTTLGHAPTAAAQLLRRDPKIDDVRIRCRQKRRSVPCGKPSASSARRPHPEAGTRTWIPRPFRMSGWVPSNGPLLSCIGMVAMAQSTMRLRLVGWWWLKQSQLALINVFNRNACINAESTALLRRLSHCVVEPAGSAGGPTHGQATAASSASRNTRNGPRRRRCGLGRRCTATRSR